MFLWIIAGLKQPRLTGAAYDAVVDDFMSAVQAWRPHVMVQFEDFGNTNAFRCACIAIVPMLLPVAVTKEEYICTRA
jgi:hypothetical protein